MKHLVEIANDYIAIEETKTKKAELEIYNERLNDSCFISLNIEQLHSFIGTLLHVQQKLKNR
jgi:hypothetical protein